MGILDTVFFPKKKKNIFNMARYLHDLESGHFRDVFNLGIQEIGQGSWRLKDFTKEPNAVFGGAMGSGKSKATIYTALTWMLANSDQTIMFITDSLKGAVDYKELFNLPQVYTEFTESGIHKIVDLLYDEIQERKKLFSELKAESIVQYDKNVQKWNRMHPNDQRPDKMARCLLLMEEFHAVPYQIMNFHQDFKKELTTASKFHQIMRVGRSYGVWVMACSQKITASDIPSEIVPNFTQKQIFKVSKAESLYFLSNPMASNLMTDQKGRCITEEGPVQFPLIPETTQAALLEKYAQPLTAGCAYLTDQLIKDYLAGRSTEELYKFKRLTDLVSGIQNFDHKVVISLLHKKMGHIVNPPPEGDKYDLSCIVDWPNVGAVGDRKVAVMARIGNKLSSKHVARLAKAMEQYRCSNGIIYTTEQSITKSVYTEANEIGIEIVDQEDLLALAKTVESNKEKNLEFDPTQLADDDKESGEYQKRKEKESSGKEELEKDYQYQSKSKEQIKKEAEEKAKEFVNQIHYPEIDDDELESEEYDYPEEIHIPEGLDGEDPHNYPEDFVEDENSEEEPFSDYEDQEDLDEEDVDIDNQQINEEEDYSGLLIADKPNFKPLKRIPVRSNFNLKSDETARLLIHLLRNEKGEVFRALFLSIADKEVRHKFFLDREVSGEFKISDMKRLGITSYINWNDQQEVLSHEEFKERFNDYLSNFDASEFPVQSFCWQNDLEFIESQMESKKVSKPKTIEDLIISTYSFEKEQTKRDFLISEFGIKNIKDDLFEEIMKDYQLWFSIF